MNASRPGVRRIIVDCTFIAPHPAPTGIPRVVEKYVVHGAAVAARAGVELIPAEFAQDGFHRRAAVEINTPARSAPRSNPLFRVWLEAVRYGSRVILQGANLVAALFPLRPVKKTMLAVAQWAADLVPNIRHRATARRKVGERIELGEGDILFCPGYWHDMEMEAYEAARAGGAEVVFLVHDILPVTMPTFYQYPWRQDFAQRLSRSFSTVSHYYCISQQTLSQVRAYGEWQGHAVRGSIAYNGFDPAPERVTGAARLDDGVADLLARRPWLMVGTLEPKKGHADVIAALEHLWGEGYERPLVIVGRHGWMSEPIVDSIKNSPWLGTHLFWFEGLDDASLAAFYEGAHALLFGSLAEGFGLPLLEAISHSTPVIARNTLVAREILGEEGAYFSDMKELVARILEMEAPATLAALRANATRLSWYRWAEVVEAVVTDLLRTPADRRQDAALLAGVSRESVAPGPEAQTSPRRKAMA
ncbi:glycosyltransferase family 1 protein [Aquabacter sp. CN5-332]|uniref:glycosyltransferase family 4 protein n=1 Tax=Aquabacter sp. CN5-332 TaxID=3156608 RepID=UPI0032B3DEE4